MAEWTQKIITSTDPIIITNSEAFAETIVIISLDKSTTMIIHIITTKALKGTEIILTLTLTLTTKTITLIISIFLAIIIIITLPVILIIIIILAITEAIGITKIPASTKRDITTPESHTARVLLKDKSLDTITRTTRKRRIPNICATTIITNLNTSISNIAIEKWNQEITTKRCNKRESIVTENTLPHCHTVYPHLQELPIHTHLRAHQVLQSIAALTLTLHALSHSNRPHIIFLQSHPTLHLPRYQSQVQPRTLTLRTDHKMLDIINTKSVKILKATELSSI